MADVRTVRVEIQHIFLHVQRCKLLHESGGGAHMASVDHEPITGTYCGVSLAFFIAGVFIFTLLL